MPALAGALAAAVLYRGRRDAGVSGVAGTSASAVKAHVGGQGDPGGQRAPERAGDCRVGRPVDSVPVVFSSES